MLRLKSAFFTATSGNKFTYFQQIIVAIREYSSDIANYFYLWKCMIFFDFSIDKCKSAETEKLIVGGMPAAVNEFINTNSFVAVADIQNRILNEYIAD